MTLFILVIIFFRIIIFIFTRKKKEAKGGKQISRFINYLCSLKPKRKKRDGLMVNQNYIKHHQWPFFFYDTR